MNKNVLYWIELSEYDLETAASMLESKRYLYVGFMCHQSIEKVLKALFIFRLGKNPPYTHNLFRLADSTGLYELFTEEQKEHIDVLEPLYIESRYPTYKEELFKQLSNEKCIEIIKQTKSLQLWIKMKLLKN
ncbi:MAG: HEPN domain-containing protein [Bacteroidota bacterium]